MKLRLLSFLLLGFILTSSNMFAQNVRSFGYFPQYRSTSMIGEQAKLLTDVCFSFINPNTNGTLKTSGYSSDQVFGFDNNKFTVVKDAVASAGSNLWISLGGADSGHQRDNRLTSVSANATYRQTLCTELVQFCVDNGIYGISVDWEFPDGSTALANHVKLLEDLNSTIASSSNPNIQVAIAVGGEYKGTANHFAYIHSDLLGSKGNLVDEWHIMAYDFPASYNTNHSAYADAEGSMDGWNTKGAPYAKQLVGVPFYARNASRTGENEYNNVNSSKSTSIYNADVSSGWYYNGKSTLEAKIDLAVAKGAMGILIWDLGQDFHPVNDANVSLLKAIDDKINSVCPIAKPNLGPDKGVCAPNSITLDPGVTGGSLTFTWTKDGQSTGGNTPTLSVSDAGTYKVSISNGSCYRDDEIVIVSGSPITTTGASGCDDETLTLSINNPDGSKTYDWYDQDVSGTKVNTGTTYADIFTSTQTFYVEEKAAGVVNYTSEPQTIGTNYAWDNGSRADYLKVDADLTIKSIRVYADGPNGCSFKIKVLKEVDNSLVDETSVINIAADGTKQSWEYTLQDVTVDIQLTPGEYFVTAEITSGNLAMQWGVTGGHTEAGVFELGTNMHTDFGSGFLKSEMQESSYANYGHLYKYVIETGANASCGRTPVTVTVIQCGPPDITIVSPTNTGTYINTEAIDFEATVTDGSAVQSVVFEVWKGTTKVATIPTNKSGSSYTGTWTPTVAGTDYEFKVIATDDDNNTSEAFMDFDVDLDVSVQDVIANGEVAVYPNPAVNDFNVALNMVASSDVAIEVVNTVGAVVFSNNYQLAAGEQLININSAELNNGLYFVNVKVADAVISTPLNVVK